MAQFVPVCFGQVTRTSGSVAVIWDLGAKIARTSLMAPELAVGSLVKFRMRRQSDLVITETGVCEWELPRGCDAIISVPEPRAP